MVGGNDQLVFDGSSFAMTGDGELAAQAKSFAEDLIVFDSAREPATTMIPGSLLTKPLTRLWCWEPATTYASVVFAACLWA